MLSQAADHARGSSAAQLPRSLRAPALSVQLPKLPQLPEQLVVVGLRVPLWAAVLLLLVLVLLATVCAARGLDRWRRRGATASSSSSSSGEVQRCNNCES
jgi:hypothetical protein